MNGDDSFEKSSDLSSGRRPKPISEDFSKLSSPFMRYGHLNFLTFQKRCQVFRSFTPGKHRFFKRVLVKLLANAHIAPTAPKPGHGKGGNYAEPTAAVSGRPDDQGDHKVAQRAMRRKVAAARGRHDRPHARPLSSFRCETRRHRSMHGREQRLAASRSENSSTQGLQQHPERMTRACLVSIMNASWHELVWVPGASGESVWRLASTVQQQ